VARLKELYGLRDEESIARELNRPVASVRKMAESLFPMATRKGPWTAPEVQELKRYLGVAGEEVIARVLGRTPEEVKRQITELGRIQSTGRWTPEEVAELKRVYGTRTDDDIALIFGRSVESVQRMATKLCLAKDKAFVRKLKGTPATRMPRWSAEEIEQLKQLYPEHSNLEIAQALNRSVKSVVSKAHNLGLKKDRSRLQEMGRENVSLRYKREGDE
jgi:DNA-binding CsgD family transcriptional regulator